MNRWADDGAKVYFKEVSLRSFNVENRYFQWNHLKRARHGEIYVATKAWLLRFVLAKLTLLCFGFDRISILKQINQFRRSASCRHIRLPISLVRPKWPQLRAECDVEARWKQNRSKAWNFGPNVCATYLCPSPCVRMWDSLVEDISNLEIVRYIGWTRR